MAYDTGRFNHRADPQPGDGRRAALLERVRDFVGASKPLWRLPERLAAGPQLVRSARAGATPAAGRVAAYIADCAERSIMRQTGHCSVQMVLLQAPLQHARAEYLDQCMLFSRRATIGWPAFARELVEQSQQPQTAAVVGTGFHEMVAPQVIPSLGPQANRIRRRARLGRAASIWPELLALRAADALHAIFAHKLAGELEQRGDTPVAIAVILTGQSDNSPE